MEGATQEETCVYFEFMLKVVFLNIFLYKNNIFYFLKHILNINILKKN